MHSSFTLKSQPVITYHIFQEQSMLLLPWAFLWRKNCCKYKYNEHGYNLTKITSWQRRCFLWTLVIGSSRCRRVPPHISCAMPLNRSPEHTVSEIPRFEENVKQHLRKLCVYVIPCLSKYEWTDEKFVIYVWAFLNLNNAQGKVLNRGKSWMAKAEDNIWQVVSVQDIHKREGVLEGGRIDWDYKVQEFYSSGNYKTG